MTEWRSIPGYEGLYRVSDEGQVESLPRPTRRTVVRLRPCINDQGYFEVVLSGGGQRRTRNVHALVAAAFLGPRPNGYETRHLNGDSLDNRLENLAYGTHSENQRDAVLHGRNANANKTHCIRDHEFTPENTFIRKDGTRRCRSCHALRRATRSSASPVAAPPIPQVASA